MSRGRSDSEANPVDPVSSFVVDGRGAVRMRVRRACVQRHSENSYRKTVRPLL